MAKRKQKQPDVMEQELPVDKLDLFLQANFKKILIATAAVVILVFVVIGVKQYKEAKYSAMIDNVGAVELDVIRAAGSDESLEKFTALANTYPEMSGYIYFTSALIVNKKGDTKKAQEYLAKVDGDLRELAQGMLYDSGVTGADLQAYKTSGKMKEVWAYRQILAAKDEQKAELIKEFKAQYPESGYNDLLENWEG